MSDTKAGPSRWAPWWVYVVIIVGANLAKQQLIEGRVPDIANVAITLVLVGVLVAMITAVYRSMSGRRGS